MTDDVNPEILKSTITPGEVRVDGEPLTDEEFEALKLMYRGLQQGPVDRLVDRIFGPPTSVPGVETSPEPGLPVDRSSMPTWSLARGGRHGNAASARIAASPYGFEQK